MQAAPPEPGANFLPLLGERHVALAVSGGSDSVALMRLAAAWAGRSHPGLKLSVLTVDHGLREASAAEAAQVGQWAATLGLSHETLVWLGEKPRTGLQAKARAARYGLMSDWCRARGAGLLLTAHTLDDQAETVLMRLSRTMSPGSLAAIAPLGSWEGLGLFRPLLAARRQSLREYLSALGQPWLEDPSNRDQRFERVRVRQSLAGLVSHGVTPERLSALAEASARTAGLLEECARRWIRRWLQEEEGGICHVPAEHFRQLPPALRQRILGLVVGHYGGGQSPPEADELRRLDLWVAGGTVRCTLGGALLGRRKQGFWVTREAARISPEPLVVPDEGSALWDGRFLLTAAPGTQISAAGRRQIPLATAIPALARRGYPWAEPPQGASAPVTIRFLRLGEL